MPASKADNLRSIARTHPHGIREKISSLSSNLLIHTHPIIILILSNWEKKESQGITIGIGLNYSYSESETGRSKG